MKTGLPTALVYGWDRFGEIRLTTDIYWEEDLFEDVIIHSYPSSKNFKNDFANHRSDIIIVFGDIPKEISDISIHDTVIASKLIHYDEYHEDNIFANIIVCQSTFWACKSQKEIYGNSDTPILSVFTPTYETNERIFRTYDSLTQQTYQNWEWVVVDDSPEGDYRTWEYLKQIASTDHRVHIHRMTPNSNGNVGEVKHRAAMLCNGEWLFELDHDDVLISTCLQEVLDASKVHPDAGFIYTDVTEVYEDGSPRKYTNTIGDDWYGHTDNTFAWGYAGHTWEEFDGKTWLTHHYPDMNPKTIRFNIGMPNHCRVWHRDTYHKVRGHSRNISVADDYELIVKTFLETKMIHLKRMMYVQYNNHNSTVDNNRVDINRRARLIRDYYDPFIHERIKELGGYDWSWDYNSNRCYQLTNEMDSKRYGDREEVLNYIIK